MSALLGYLLISICLLYGLSAEDQVPNEMERCKRPDNDKPYTFIGNKAFYNPGEEVAVRCNSDAHLPEPARIRCVQGEQRDEWTSSPQCVGISMTAEDVTSTSISFQISCTPKCPRFWKYHVQCCVVNNKRLTCDKSKNNRRGTFTNLTPHSLYRIRARIYISGILHTLQPREIWTKESAPQPPTIVKFPQMNETTMRWTLPASKENITGFQMNISAWKDYDPSFKVHPEFLWFPVNVTEYKIPLQYGTNYTITLRGFTAAGAGEVVSTDIQTEIGDPPHHMEKTMSDRTLQLCPVHNLHGPISSYEIIVFRDQEGNLTSDCLRFINVVYNSSRSPSLYTAAVLPAEDLTAPRTFTLGDNKYYNSFHNTPLLPGHNYTVYIRVTSRWRKMTKSSCAFAGFLVASEQASSYGGIIVRSVAIVILMFILILVEIWSSCYSRKSSHSPDILLKARTGLGT